MRHPPASRSFQVHVLPMVLVLLSCSKSAEPSTPPPTLPVQSEPVGYRLPERVRPPGPVGVESLLNGSVYWRILLWWPVERPIADRQEKIAALVRKHLPGHEVTAPNPRADPYTPRLNTIELFDLDRERNSKVECIRAPCGVGPRFERLSYVEFLGETSHLGQTLHALARLSRDLKALPGGPTVTTPVLPSFFEETTWRGDVPDVLTACERSLDEPVLYGWDVAEHLALPIFHFLLDDKPYSPPPVLVQAIAQRLLENPLPDGPGELVVDIRAFTNDEARQRFSKLLGPSARGRVKFFVEEKAPGMAHRRALQMRIDGGPRGLCEFFHCDGNGGFQRSSPD